MARGPSRPSCTALGCIGLLGLIELCTLLLLLLPVFWGLPGEQAWERSAHGLARPHASPAAWEPKTVCPASSTHLSSPRRRRLCHTMTPMSRAAAPRPPRIPRARAIVPSPGPPTEPVGKWEGEGPAPPFLSCWPSPHAHGGQSSSLTCSSPSPAVGPSSPVSGRQSQSQSERKAAGWRGLSSGSVSFF